jgi:nucleoside-diphosphate-sugar epimerase
MESKNLKIAITGATGFIGKRLVKAHLLRGDSVRILTRSSNCTVDKNVSIFYGDIAAHNVPEDLFYDVDIFYHCAAELINPKAFETVNEKGTEYLLDMAKDHVKRWIQLSSCGVYGLYRPETITESSSLKPTNAYEISKALADEIVIKKAPQLGMFYVILRPTNVFGNDMPNGSLRAMASAIKKGLFFYIGKSNPIASYVHVDDVVEGLIACGTHPNALNQIYNLSYDCDLKDMIDGLARALNVTEPKLRISEPFVRFLVKVFSPVPGFPLTHSRINALTNPTTYPYTKILSGLNFQPKHMVPETIKEILQ